MFQKRTGFVLTLIAPFIGKDRVGATGAVEKVEKCHTEDHELAPAELEANTRQ